MVSAQNREPYIKRPTPSLIYIHNKIMYSRFLITHIHICSSSPCALAPKGLSVAPHDKTNLTSGDFVCT